MQSPTFCALRSLELDSKFIYRVRISFESFSGVVTSHSSQGQTADRVLIHADTELGAKDLLNNRMAYVAVSRGAYDAQIFTNSIEKLPAALGHDVSHESAHKPEQAITPQQEISHGPQHEQGPEYDQGPSLGISL